jgi:isoamylase
MRCADGLRIRGIPFRRSRCFLKANHSLIESCEAQFVTANTPRIQSPKVVKPRERDDASGTATKALGTSGPIGATLCEGGANFSLYSRDATRVELLFFDGPDDDRPSRIIPLDPVTNHTYHYWHVFVEGARSGQIYAYRVDGPSAPAAGLRFDATKLLLDPYGRGVVFPKKYSRQSAMHAGDNIATAMKSLLIDPSTYDWEGDVPLRHPSARTIIYEMHVRGFTANPNSGVSNAKRGTYAGLIEKIPYLQQLGITAVELLPVFQFDAQDCPPGLVNYWGYAPVSFFAPHTAYSSRQDLLGPVDEFRDMVKALHRGGIEVILDVVFNHTAEGDERGPTFGFRGIDNIAYYMLDSDRGRYSNYSGCGNTLNANHPIVRRMIVDSLRYWVEQMHVDGFRFDLAAVLSRDEDGNVLPNPPVLWDIETDPVLAGTKLIAEAWDAAGLYEVGTFLGDSWKEWNGRFRDDARDFMRAQPGALARFADRMIGSPQLYSHEQRDPEQSVNFVTCHDGFTLNDLVSYNDKHNESNREDNRDGANDNRSWNCGVEGPTEDPAIRKLRNQQVKNFLTVTLFSLGTPMLLMGDEVGRTQHGNNNAYCHDDDMTWFDWNLLDTHSDILRFTKMLVARRAVRTTDHEENRISLNDLIKQSVHGWHGTDLNKPDWSEDSHSVALSFEFRERQLSVHWILNAYWEALDFELPPVCGDFPLQWRRWIDTSLDSPADIVAMELARPVAGPRYRAAARSVVLLVASHPDTT